jgi:hypothetical protein
MGYYSEESSAGLPALASCVTTKSVLVGGSALIDGVCGRGVVGR